jgi:flagellar basal-body rod protein FlgC
MSGSGGLFKGLEVSASGLRAERMRMETIAQNIANAGSTRGPNGEKQPYRRREVVFETVLGEEMGAAADMPAGVRVREIIEDQSPPVTVYKPGHPDADQNGMLLTSNVSLPTEMVDLITASRAYEANLSAIRGYRDMIMQALMIGR